MHRAFHDNCIFKKNKNFVEGHKMLSSKQDVKYAIGQIWSQLGHKENAEFSAR